MKIEGVVTTMISEYPFKYQYLSMPDLPLDTFCDTLSTSLRACSVDTLYMLWQYFGDLSDNYFRYIR